MSTNNKLVPNFLGHYGSSVESISKRYGLVFSLIVLYQGLFGGISLSQKPAQLVSLSQNPYFKFLTMTAIAFTATKDLETAIIASLMFLLLLHLLRTPEERKQNNGFFI